MLINSKIQVPKLRNKLLVCLEIVYVTIFASSYI